MELIKQVHSTDNKVQRRYRTLKVRQPIEQVRYQVRYLVICHSDDSLNRALFLIRNLDSRLRGN